MDDVVDIGFSGTRDGMTAIQKNKVSLLLAACYNPGSIKGHHGDCVGADAEFHVICRELGFKTVIHLPVDEDLRAFCTADEYRDPLTYLKRNRCIVAECRIMMAAPPTMEELPRGGTWYTIRYTRKLKIPTFLWIILPDGQVSHEHCY